MPNSNTTTELLKHLVRPTRVLLVKTMPCEEKAAHIRNQAVQAMLREDERAVEQRYLQSKLGESVTRNNISFLLAMIYLSYFLLKPAPEEANPSMPQTYLLLLRISFPLLFAIDILPNTSNYFRYRQTKQLCLNWLTPRLEPTNLQQLEAYPVDNLSLA